MITNTESTYSAPQSLAPAPNRARASGVNALIEELKDCKQDFEFYPTTEEIIHRLCSDLGQSCSSRYVARAFANGNIHVRLNQRFALALNVEHGRLKGWLKSAAEAAVEMNDSSASALFGSNLQLGANSLLLLGGSAS